MTEEEREKKIEFMSNFCHEISEHIRQKLREGITKKIFTYENILNEHLLVLSGICKGTIKHMSRTVDIPELQITSKFVDNMFK